MLCCAFTCSFRSLVSQVNELTNWVSKTRLKSAHLLKVIVVLCEEHLTMEASELFPSFIKALRFARDDKDEALHALLLEVFELFGRYVAPEIYIYYVLPRLKGDPSVVQFGVDAQTRITVMEFLQAMLEGSKPSLVAPYFADLVGALTDPYVISTDSDSLQQAALNCLLSLCVNLKGKNNVHNALIESHFVATGRMTTLKVTMRRAFRFLLADFSNPALHEQSHAALLALAALASDSPSAVVKGSLEHLHALHALPLLDEVLHDYSADSDWSEKMTEHVLLCRLLEAPGNPVQGSPAAVGRVLSFLCTSISELDGGSMTTAAEEDVLLALADLLYGLLLPIYAEEFASAQPGIICRPTISLLPIITFLSISHCACHSAVRPSAIGEVGGDTKIRPRSSDRRLLQH